MSKKNRLDQYYTNPKLAKEIVKTVPKNKYFIEPAAGSGVFLNALKDRIGTIRSISNVLAFDLEPKTGGIIETDFLTVNWKKYTIPISEKIIVITNPPFGKNASLAVKFFNKCAEVSDDIRFIVPKSFRKQSIQKRLNRYFHLIKDTDLPYNSFTLNGKPYNVPCCFQIWKRKKIKRLLDNTITNSVPS